jgi:transcriptional regulator with XRE-family HTH domain
MADNKSLELRAKIIGVLLRDARIAAGKSPKECGDVLAISATAYSNIELGNDSPSLPELELLSYYLNIPLSHFWDEDILSEAPERTTRVNTGELLKLRNRIIGLQIRQARTASSMGLKALATTAGITINQLKTYELGEAPIPMPQLEIIAWALGMKMDAFFEQQGPVGEWDASSRAYEQFKQLPQELQDFVMNPLNESYIRVAMRLAGIPADKIKDMAATLLDITY